MRSNSQIYMHTIEQMTAQMPCSNAIEHGDCEKGEEKERECANVI